MITSVTPYKAEQALESGPGDLYVVPKEMNVLRKMDKTVSWNNNRRDSISTQHCRPEIGSIS